MIDMTSLEKLQSSLKYLVEKKIADNELYEKVINWTDIQFEKFVDYCNENSNGVFMVPHLIKMLREFGG